MARPKAMLVGLLLVLVASVLGACGVPGPATSPPPLTTSAHPVAGDPSGKHRYVVLLDGIGSNGAGVSDDFAEITARLNLSSDLRRVVQFSYGAANSDSAGKACAGWQGCDWRSQPTYDAGQVSGTSTDGQVVTLDWLIDQIRQEDPTARVDLVSFSLGGVVASRWAGTIGLTDAGRAKGVMSIVLVESPVGGSPQANACLNEVRGICSFLRSYFGDAHLVELQVPTSPGEPAGSIVANLPAAASAYDVTAIESQADYLVNGRSLPTGFGPALVASGTQGWASGHLTRHADNVLGGDLIEQPINLLDLPNIIISRHVPPLHHPCTANWVSQALLAAPGPACTAPSLNPSESLTPSPTPLALPDEPSGAPSQTPGGSPASPGASVPTFVCLGGSPGQPCETGSGPATPGAGASTPSTPGNGLGEPTGPPVPLPASAWSSVGGASVGPGSTADSFRVSFSTLYWGGVRHDATPGCDYRLSGLARVVDGDGYGFAVRTELGQSSPIGQAFQYDPGAGGYRDTQYPNSEGGTITPAATDSGWHRIELTALGSRYLATVDGTNSASGTTGLDCGGLYLRLWHGTAEFRDMSVTPMG